MSNLQVRTLQVLQKSEESKVGEDVRKENICVDYNLGRTIDNSGSEGRSD